LIKSLPQNPNNIGSFLNPINIKIYEEDSEYLKMKLNLKFFTAGIVKTILTVPKSSNLEEFATLLKEAFILEDLSVEFFDLQRYEIDKSCELANLPENNEFFVQVKGTLREEGKAPANVKCDSTPSNPKHCVRSQHQ
jgi:hypothetical protein